MKAYKFIAKFANEEDWKILEKVPPKDWLSLEVVQRKKLHRPRSDFGCKCSEFAEMIQTTKPSWWKPGKVISGELLSKKFNEFTNGYRIETIYLLYKLEGVLYDDVEYLRCYDFEDIDFFTFL